MPFSHWMNKEKWITWCHCKIHNFRHCIFSSGGTLCLFKNQCIYITSVRDLIRDRWECFFFYQMYSKFWFLCLLTKTEQNRPFVNVLLSTEKKCQNAFTDKGGELPWLLKTLYVACKKVESALRKKDSINIFPLWKCGTVKLNFMDAQISTVNFLI